MLKTIENRILNFVDTLEITRSEIVHGTLYVKLDNDRDCDDVHAIIRTFYRTKINPTGGVNMYAVGDEFAFDFVPEDREAPVFCDETYSGKEEMDPTDTDEKGVWSEFAEEEMFNNLDLTDEEDAELDVLMKLEAESQRGK